MCRLPALAGFLSISIREREQDTDSVVLHQKVRARKRFNSFSPLNKEDLGPPQVPVFYHEMSSDLCPPVTAPANQICLGVEGFSRSFQIFSAQFLTVFLC